MIVMFLGDVHGNRGFCIDAINIAANLGVDRLVQVGDFGFWPAIESGQRFLKEIGVHANKAHLPFYWIAGNHEDHDRLDTETAGPDPTVEPFHHGKRLTHIRNGARWIWDDVVFGCLSGAYSIDRKYRVKHSYAYGWFPQEVPNPDLIPGLGKVDVLVTHEAPTVPAPLAASGNFRLIPESGDSQLTIFEAMRSADPDHLVHGHWHCNYRNRIGRTEIWGLDCDLSVINASCVYDTETRQMYSLSQWIYVREEEGHGPQAQPQYRATR